MYRNLYLLLNFVFISRTNAAKMQEKCKWAF
jgi:hypothetical protein